MPSKNEYKVVRCFYRKNDYDNPNNFELGCEILTISNYGTNNSIADCCSAWRMLEEGCPHLMDANPALVNGSLHWKIDLVWERREDEQILSFDLDAEKFWILPIPPCVIRNPETLNLAELRQDLWLSHYDYSIPHVMDMWVLKDFEKFTWVKVYSIDFSPINTSTGKYELTFVLNVRNEELLILMNSGRLIYYNLKTKSFTDLGAPRNGFNFCYYTDVVSFH
ncbi:PREDICTED: F-box protein At3g07870 [Theobroma cacao]|uniref:F-box protein At3g07870 n=1 Tax=Theobroma cacao TaxID=3641 RepID=A0AB32VWP6_THECC|nr:PREDICTED: F-box protein At3g07870 [Theobroma cacao]